LIIGRDEQGKRDLIENELGEMARWKERDSEIDFFYKERKRKREKQYHLAFFIIHSAFPIVDLSGMFSALYFRINTKIISKDNANA